MKTVIVALLIILLVLVVYSWLVAASDADDKMGYM